MIEELVDFVYDNYDVFRERGIGKGDLYKVYTTFPENFVVLRNNGTFNLVAFYQKVNNKIFRLLKNRKLDMTNPKNMIKIFKSSGDNIHFLFAISKGMKFLREGIKQVREKHHPKTISWYSPDMTQFHCFKRS